MMAIVQKFRQRIPEMLPIAGAFQIATLESAHVSGMGENREILIHVQTNFRR